MANNAPWIVIPAYQAGYTRIHLTKELLALGAKNILSINDGSDKVHYSLFDDFASTFMLIRSYDTENRIARLFKQGKRD